MQAILYGPYLLAGLSSGDWDIKATSSDWIAPVATENSYLVSLTQESGNDVFVLTNSNQSITMDKYPKTGTDSAIKATFRLISKDTAKTHSAPTDFIGKLVTLEAFDYPGRVVMHQGKDNNLVVTDSSDDSSSSAFLLTAGLDGKNGTVSLESSSQRGCYVYSGADYKPGLGVKLSCMDGSSDAGFKHAASFKLETGISEDHPISFVAKGAERNFVLVPLLSLRDESYTVYFNIQS